MQRRGHVGALKAHISANTPNLVNFSKASYNLIQRHRKLTIIMDIYASNSTRKNNKIDILNFHESMYETWTCWGFKKLISPLILQIQSIFQRHRNLRIEFDQKKQKIDNKIDILNFHECMQRRGSCWGFERLISPLILQIQSIFQRHRNLRIEFDQKRQ